MLRAEPFEKIRGDPAIGVPVQEDEGKRASRADRESGALRFVSS